MNPWGLSGPEFLWLYAASLLLGLGVAIGVRRKVRRPRLAEPPGRLHVVELGFLGGGPVNAVQVAVARLVESGAARVNRSGEVSAVAPSPGEHPLDDAVLAGLAKPKMVAAIVKLNGVERVLAEIGESLVRRGLLVAPATAVRSRWLAPVVLYVVFAVGVVRWINGVANDLPVDYLTFLLAVTGTALVLLSNRVLAAPKARTVRGDRLVTEIRKRDKDADSLERAAVNGPRALADVDLSHALSSAALVAIVPVAWSYAAGDSFASHVAAASSSSSSGGYSCGTSSSSGSASSCGGGGGCGGGSSS